MSTSKHTPGPWDALPWEVDAGGTDWNVWGPKASNHIGNYDLMGEYGSEADARLISASTELLAVSSAITITGPDANGLCWVWFGSVNGSPQAGVSIKSPMATKAALAFEGARAAAIAKAEGRS